MTNTYDSTGIVLDRYADILVDLVAAAVARWGESVDTSKEEWLGQFLRDEASLSGDINEVVQAVYDAMSVSNSSGVPLDNLMELINLPRQDAAKSTVVLTLQATEATTVLAGTLYGTVAGVNFSTDVTQVFTGAGTADVAATCTVVGEKEAGPGEVSVLVESTFGISVVTNAAAAVVGSIRETDSELKEAHTLATSTSGDRDTASIFEAVRKVSGNSAAYVSENKESYVVDGQAGNSIHVSVIGGSNEDIATAIDNNRTGSLKTVGAQSTTIYNETTSQAETILHDIAVDVPIYIKMTLQPYTGIFPDDGVEQIQAKFVDYFAPFNIKQDVIYTGLYLPIYSVPGHYVVGGTLKLGTGASPTGITDLTMTALQRAEQDEDDIETLVVISLLTAIKP